MIKSHCRVLFWIENEFIPPFWYSTSCEQIPTTYRRTVAFVSGKLYTRACLKKAFRELRVSVCGRFYPNEGGVAGYGNRMRVKYTAKWGLQIAEMIFQTRSKAMERRASDENRNKN